MVDFTKVRYAVIVAVIGLAVAMWPGLPALASIVIQWAAGIVGVLWAFLRIAGEFIDRQDPMVYTQGRAAPGESLGFWATVRKAI